MPRAATVWTVLAIAAAVAAGLPALAQQPPAKAPPSAPAQPKAPPPAPVESRAPAATEPVATTAKSTRRKKSARKHRRKGKARRWRERTDLCSVVNGWRAFPTRDPSGYVYTGRRTWAC